VPASASAHIPHGRTTEELLHKADAAMYKVKSQGRHGYAVYSEVIGINQDDEAVLRAAVANDEFVMHYQPLIDSSGRFESLEALMRWQSPTRGMVSPGAFIPLAESTGIIVNLGQLALEKVCRQIAFWSSSNITFRRIAVNISPQQLEAS